MENEWSLKMKQIKQAGREARIQDEAAIEAVNEVRIRIAKYHEGGKATRVAHDEWGALREVVDGECACELHGIACTHENK
jgi:hypothetical protein